MNAVINPETCIGCSLCCGMCGAVFRMNDEGKAEAYQAATEENRGDVQSAIDSCPAAAISWAD